MKTDEPILRRAIKKAINILEYADNTEKRLREKLRRGGFDEETVDGAVEYVKKQGYLNDARYIRHAADYLATSKLYGRLRIVNELYAKGFRRDDIDSLDWEELEIDFVSVCRERIRRTGSRYDDPRRLYAALARYGFLPSEIREAMKDDAEV